MGVRRLVARAVAVVMIFVGVGAYLVAMAGALPPIWDFMTEMDAIRNGPFWELAKQYRTVATAIVPGVLIASGLFVWLVSAVREEATLTTEQRIRRP